MADYLEKIPNMKAFIDFHSYSQMWMSPWGYTKTHPKDFDDQVSEFNFTCSYSCE